MHANIRAAGWLLILLGMPLSAETQAQIYKWVDAQGVTHYGAQPPTGIKTETINIGTGVSQSLPASAPPTALPSAPQTDQQAIIDKQVKHQVMMQETERQAYCTQLRTNLAQLQNNPRIHVQQDNGEIYRLSDEERQPRITEAEALIKKNCE